MQFNLHGRSILALKHPYVASLENSCLLFINCLCIFIEYFSGCGPVEWIDRQWWGRSVRNGLIWQSSFLIYNVSCCMICKINYEEKKLSSKWPCWLEGLIFSSLLKILDMQMAVTVIPSSWRTVAPFPPSPPFFLSLHLAFSFRVSWDGIRPWLN